MPARRKFLKSPATELRHATAVVQAYALARPDVRLELRQSGRTLLEAAPAGADRAGTRERIGQVFGTPWPTSWPRSRRRHPRRRPDLGFRRAVPSRRADRRRFAFVNRRMVRDRAVMATFYRAVRDDWRSEEFPALFLFFDLAPEAVDVNVHPQKAEVRFRDLAVLDCAAVALRGGLRSRSRERCAGGFEPAQGSADGAPCVARARRAQADWRRRWPELRQPVPGAGALFEGRAGASRVAEGSRLAQAAYAPLERRSGAAGRA